MLIAFLGTEARSPRVNNIYSGALMVHETPDLSSSSHARPFFCRMASFPLFLHDALLSGLNNHPQSAQILNNPLDLLTCPDQPKPTRSISAHTPVVRILVITWKVITHPVEDTFLDQPLWESQIDFLADPLLQTHLSAYRSSSIFRGSRELPASRR